MNRQLKLLGLVVNNPKVKLGQIEIAAEDPDQCGICCLMQRCQLMFLGKTESDIDKRLGLALSRFAPILRISLIFQIQTTVEMGYARILDF